MKQRTWTAEQKFMIVLEGIKGKPVSQICTDHGVSQNRYYIWRDRFFDHAARVFDTANQRIREQRLIQENTALKALVGELAMQVKKTNGVVL